MVCETGIYQSGGVARVVAKPSTAVSRRDFVR